MTISKIRGLFYFLARILGDVSAVKKGTVGLALVLILPLSVGTVHNLLKDAA